MKLQAHKQRRTAEEERGTALEQSVRTILCVCVCVGGGGGEGGWGGGERLKPCLLS